MKTKLSKLIKQLDDRSKRLFAADCAERGVDGIKDPELKTRTIALIQRVRDCANELITVDELAADRTAYLASCWAAYRTADRAAYRVADWAADSAAYRGAYGAAYGAAYWDAYRAAYRAADGAADRAADEAVEQEWQIGRLREYIREME